MADAKETPFHQKLSFNLLSIALICTALILGKIIILPLMFAMLLGCLLLPITQWLQEKKFNRPLSILLPLAITVIVTFGILFFLSSQVANFVDDLPALKEKSTAAVNSLQTWINENIHITVRKQNQYLTQTFENLKEQGPQIMGATFASLKDIFTYALFIPIYSFLILYYRKNIKSFLIGTFKNGSEQKVREVLQESTSISQQYVTGLLIETTIVFSLNLLGFFIIGVKYKVLLALLAALLNLIPYVGMLVANIICMLSTFITSDNPKDVIWVGVALLVVQFVDNNFGMPLIVGNKVRINALATIVGVVVGGTLCGVPGMFLAIPVLAVLKIIFDKVPDLQPWALLLSDDQSSPIGIKKPRILKSKLSSK